VIADPTCFCSVFCSLFHLFHSSTDEESEDGTAYDRGLDVEGDGACGALSNADPTCFCSLLCSLFSCFPRFQLGFSHCLLDEESEDGTAYDRGEDEEDDGACFGGTVLGGGYAQNDYSTLALKPDHYNRPLWVCSDGRLFLETYSPIYKQVGWNGCVWGGEGDCSTRGGGGHPSGRERGGGGLEGAVTWVGVLLRMRRGTVLHCACVLQC
jgi:hypothetical protein